MHLKTLRRLPAIEGTRFNAAIRVAKHRVMQDAGATDGAEQLALALAMNEVAFADGETIVEEGASVGWDDTSMFYVLTGAREYCCPSLLHCECACCHAPDRVLRVLPQLSASPKALASSKCTPRANGLASVG